MSGPALAVVARPSGTLSKVSHPRLQKCSSGGSARSHADCECNKKRRTVQRVGTKAAPARIPPIVDDVLRSPGRPLEPATRALAKSRLGHDLSNVRVHTDAQAAESARAVHAHAYTVGRDVVFGAGRYAPETAEGRQLLVHELAHTVQQAGFQRSAEGPIDGVSERGDPQAREPTDDLRVSWLRKLGWTEETAARNWRRAGGTPSPEGEFRPRVGGETCQMDHIVELQMHGTNVAENIQVLDPIPNRESGNEVWTWINDLAREARESLDEPRPTFVTLHFDEVTQVGEGIACSSRCPERGRRAESCCQIEQCAPDVSTEAEEEGAAPAGLEPYPIRAGAAATLDARPTPQTTELLARDATDANINGSQIIPGLLLERLNRRAGGRGDTMEATVDAVDFFGRERPTRLPPQIRDRRRPVRLNVETGTGNVSLPAGAARGVRFTYPYLSEGSLDLELDPEYHLIGTGTLTPSVPLLSRARFNLAMTRESLRASIGVPPGSLRAPFPGLRFTQADVGVDIVPDFRPSGVLAFEAGPRGRRLLSGRLEVSGDESGLLGEGELQAHIPYMDEASGRIHYRGGSWSGEIVLRSTQIRLPGFREGEVRVDFEDTRPRYSGRVKLAIPPGEQEIELGVRTSPGGGVLYSGRGTFNIPRLRPLVVDVTYDGEHFTASGRTGIDIRNVSGDVAVNYRDGQFSGHATVNLTAGRGRGTATVRLSPAGRLSGEGSVTYPFTENLVGTIGVTVPEEGAIRVRGGIEVPRPIEVFPRFPRDGGRRELLRPPRIDIPILGISVGPVSAGLVARIEFSVGVTYGIGPGTLRNIRIVTAFNPLAERTDFELEGGLVFEIPAHAGIYASVRGALGLSAGIASVTGGITVTGEARLEGGFRAEMSMRYREGRFTLDALASIKMGPRFLLGLDADITAEVGIWGLSASKTWRWALASFEWRPPLEFGLEAPVHFASDEPFTFPSFNQIRWIRPNIDVGALLSSVMGGSGRTAT